MTLVFLCFVIIASTFYSLYKGLQQIEDDEKKALTRVRKRKVAKYPATLRYIGIDSIHDFPDFIPLSILNEPDEKKADSLAYQYGINNHKNKLKKEKAINGLYVEMECFDGQKKHIINTLYQGDIDFNPFKLAKELSQKKSHFVYRDEISNSWFILKETDEQIEIKYKNIANKTIIQGGAICILSVILTLLFV